MLVAWACASAGFAACYSADPPLGAPCDSDSECPHGQTCNPRTDECGLPTGNRAWRDDTAADFAAEGADLDDVTLEAGGFVGPAAYLVGGARLTGINSQAIGNLATATWDQVAAAEPTGTSLARGLDLEYLLAAPPGLGFSQTDNITVLLEAEIELDVAGMWAFELTADDLGFIEIAPPGSAQFVRLVADDDVGTVEQYAATVPGWYRIRAAFADRLGSMNFELRYDPPNVGGNLRRIPADRIRARVGDLSGLLVDGFEDAHLVGTRGSVLRGGSLERQEFRENPFGLGVGFGSYSLRWSAQVLIETDGEYSFHIDSEDGHRAWLDGTQVADKFGSSPRETTTAPTRLEPGWHDLVVDVHKNGGEASHLAVTVAEGSAAWAGERIPPENLRPVVGRGARWAGAIGSFTTAIPDLGTTSRFMTLDLPPGMVPQQIDVGYELEHPALATLGVQLQPLVGPAITLAEVASIEAIDSYYDHDEVSPTTAGSSWVFTINDTAADGATGELTYTAVTVIGPGGIAPFSKLYRYVSGTRDLGEEPIEGFTEVTWALRQVTEETVITVSIRTCDEAAACAAEPWTMVREGGVPTAPPRRFAQYMVALTGNGDVATALDWIEIGYQVSLGR